VDVEDREAADGGLMPIMNTDGRESHARERDILAFFLRFLAISAALYLVFYLFAGKYYVRLIALVAGPMLSAFGHRIVVDRAMKIAEEISLNPLVFVSLVAAVGRVPWRTKLRGAALGAAMLFVANALTVTFAFVANYRNSEGWWTGTEILNLTNNFFLPILLWLVLIPVRSAFPFLRRFDGNGA
jgi:hypothetical protein